RGGNSGPIQHLAQLADLCAEVPRMVADKKSVIVGDVGVDDGADGVVVEEPDRLMPQETSAGDHPKSDLGTPHRLHHPPTIDGQGRIENDRETEPRAAPVLALNDEPLIVAEQLDE